MSYIFDTSSLIVLENYYPKHFSSFWQFFDNETLNNTILSVREVYNELNKEMTKTHLKEWINKHRSIFLSPNEEETKFVAEIFRIKHFQQIVSNKSILKGTPVADPFVIASARIRNGYVVTEESFKENAAKIPNICDHFNIQCINFERFLDIEYCVL